MTEEQDDRPRLLVIADAEWNDEESLRDTLGRHFRPDTILVIGDTHGPEGQARAAWISWGGLVRVYRADRARHGRLARVRRDRRMIHAGADTCLVFAVGRGRRVRDCLRAVRKADIPLEVVTAAPTPEAGEWTGPDPGSSSTQPCPVEGEEDEDDFDPACR